MHIKLLLFLVLLSLNVHAQQKANYIDYHKEVINAERLSIYHNPKEAIKKYKEIFTAWPRPFAKDCFNALQIACMIKDTANARNLFSKCFENGIAWNTVLAIPCIKEMMMNSRGYDLSIQKLYEVLHPQYLKTIDTVYRKQILNMIERELYFRHRSNGNEQITAEWMRVEDSNMNELPAIVKKKSYPGEKKIGFYDEQVRPNKNFALTGVMLSSIPAIMYFHHRCGYQTMKAELMQAVIDGELHPREYALIYEWSHVYSLRTNWDDKYHKFTCNNDKWEKKFNIYLDPLYYSRDTERVNKDRAEIGMATLEHDAKKHQFEIENRLLLYSGMFKRI